jgi:hypothetical protein
VTSSTPKSVSKVWRDKPGLGKKSLDRMLHHNGNSTARNLGIIVKSIAEDLGVKPRVEFA